MKQSVSRTGGRHIAALSIASLALLTFGSHQAVAKKAAEVGNKQAAPANAARSVDLKQDQAGPAFAKQWETFSHQVASKRSSDKAPMFGDSDLFVRFNAMTGSPRLVFGDLGLAPAAGKAGDRAMLFLQENASAFGIDTKDLSITRSLGGTAKPLHFYYAQKFEGLPVFGAEVAVHMDQNGRVWALNNTYVPVSSKSTTPAISAEQAIDAAAVACQASRAQLITDHAQAPELGIWPTADGGRLAWRTAVDIRGVGLYEVIVDAATGENIEPPLGLDCYATGTGKVFIPSPTVSLGMDSLADSASPFPEAAYISVPLPYLNDAPNTALVGTYAQVPSDQVGGRTTNATLDFSGLRRNTVNTDAFFNQENGYWAISYAQDVFQSLGYSPATTPTPNGVMAYSLQYYAHKSPHFPNNTDNSHFSPDNRSGTGTGHLCFGTGGVDDAEDQEIVWHEFGHAMLHSQRPGTAQNQNNEGVGEGTGDVLAGILSKKVASNRTYDVTVGEWDATSYNAGGSPHPFLRKLDNPTLWVNRPSEVHDAGEVWSHPVFDYNQQVGTDTGLDVMLQAQFLYDLSPTQVECANAFITADQMLNGGATAAQINNAFRERGTLAGTVVPVVHTIGVANPATGDFFLRTSATPGNADLVVGFGGGGRTPIVGDWNGNGSDTIGVYDTTTGTFFLRNLNNGGNADFAFSFGGGGLGYVPIVGDWNGDGTESIGLYDPATGNFFLRNSNSSGAADLVFSFGAGGQGYVPVIGDWNGDGTDTVGLYSPTTGAFFLRNSNSLGSADIVFSFGAGGQGYIPVAGDFNGDNTNTVGLYNPATGQFFLRNTNTPGAADFTIGFGLPGAVPLVGDWNGVAHPTGGFSPIG